MIERYKTPEGSMPGWINSLIRLNFRDFLTAEYHDEDFNVSRSTQIFNRLQAIASIYAIVGVLWLFIDYQTIPQELFLDLAAIRLLMVAGMITLAVWHGDHKNLLMARVRLALLVIVPTLFFVSSSLVLAGHTAEVAQMVYSFYPFVIVSQLAIFPLTLLEGILLVIPAFGGILLIGIVTGTAASVLLLGDMVLFLLLAFLAIWAQVSQLRMLVGLYRQATRDPLTGMFNRRLLMERVKEEEARFARSGKELSFMMIDLDKFKRINDNHGYQVGDKVLEQFAKNARKLVRAGDVIGRYGGEEFMVVLPDTSQKMAGEVAERIRNASAKMPVYTDAGEKVSFTVSIGVSQLKLGESGTNALERADVALNRAKESGRNSVELSY